MKILYTGATKQGAVQLNPDLSLGHRVSGSQIPNDMLGNLFPSISSLSLQMKKRNTKMIAFLNDEGEDVGNLQLAFSLPTNGLCKYKVAFVLPTMKGLDACFEEITDTSAIPYYATFNEVQNGTVLAIGNLADGAYLGMWITREFNTVTKKTCADWAQDLITPPTVDESETFEFSLSYSNDFSTSI